MKKLISILITAILFSMFLTACSSGPKLGERFEDEVNEYEEFTMSLINADSESITVEVLNTANFEIETGNENDCTIQKKKFGSWYTLAGAPGAITMEAYGIRPDVPFEINFNWKYRYGTLPAGHYRVVKAFSVDMGFGKRTNFFLATEFTIK